MYLIRYCDIYMTGSFHSVIHLNILFLTSLFSINIHNVIDFMWLDYFKEVYGFEPEYLFTWQQVILVDVRWYLFLWWIVLVDAMDQFDYNARFVSWYVFIMNHSLSYVSFYLFSYNFTSVRVVFSENRVFDFFHSMWMSPFLCA